MGVATIQFTQGFLVGGAGKSLLGLVPSVPVTLTDAGGAGATSELWECVSFPGPMAAPPVVTNPNSQVASFTPVIDGVYLFRLTRVDSFVVTIDYKFCGIPDVFGFYLPSAGITGTMFNIDPNPVQAMAAGWQGREDALTNVFQDATIRYLLANAGVPEVHGNEPFANEYYRVVTFAGYGFPNFADATYLLIAGQAHVTDTPPMQVTVNVIDKLATGFTFLASGQFSGEVSWMARKN